jgi:PadR family transcriptional regulator, regulatory protein PadR
MAGLDLIQGTLDFLVLQALSRRSMHGYDIARFIREGSDGTFRILDGALYTALHRMEEREWLESEWGISERGKRAKFYRITAGGRRALKVEADSWARYVTAVRKVAKAAL